MRRPERRDRMEAGYLESPHGPLFSCLHPPSGGARRDAAILFCDAFGSDRMNLHRPYRAFALRLAELGFHVLRVDYPGTCDSAGTPRDPGHCRSWIASLHLAADFLEERSGASRLGVFGALLGGTIAASFAASRREAEGLALWGPFSSGRAFLRELYAFRAFSAANPEGVRPLRYEPGDREATGFVVTRETADELAKLDVLALAGPIASDVALFPRNRSSPLDRLAEHLRKTGARVELAREADFDMNLLANDRGQLPPELVDDVAGFFARAFPARERRAQRRSSRPALAREVVLSNRKGVPVRESVASFGADGELFGIVTRSLSSVPAERPAILLVNGGTNHRVGINRNYTEWARDWAGLGLTILRMDIRGLGDSPPDPRAGAKVLYRDATRRDLRDAMDFLSERHGARRFIAIGLCAGAYQAFHTALVDPRVAGLAMLSPLRFERLSESASLGGGELQSGAPLRHYARAALDLAAWKRLVARRDLRPLARSLARKVAHRVALRARRLASAARRAEAPPASWLSGALLALTSRGCDVLLVFAAGDAMVPAFDERTGPDRRRLDRTGRFRVERIPYADHIFSPLVSQEQLERVLREAVGRWASLSAPEDVKYDHP